jgi:hypothetical protein
LDRGQRKRTTKIGKAYSFSSSKIVPATVLPWNNIQTISAWVNRGTDADTSGTGRQILGWGQGAPATVVYTHFRLFKGNLQYFNAGAVGGSATSANVVPASSWNHVVAVKNGANVQLYINGTPDGSAANLTGTMPAGVPANIGYLPGIGQNFLGGIDDVAVWNTALTDGKVRSLSTITAVLGDYSASKMDKLFQVFDGTLDSFVDSAYTWQQATGLTGHNAGDAWTAGTSYYVQLDASGGGVSGGAVRYDTWANGTFANGTLTDKNPAHDPDGDGLTNQQEFAFGLDPTTGASVSPITQQLNKGTGIFKYTRTKNSGLTYIYQYSTSLSEPWIAFTPVTDPPAATGAPVEEVTVEVAAALLNANSKLFLRVKAE